MAKLTEEQYEEYLRLLKAWVEADKLLSAMAEPPEQPPAADAAARATEAWAAVQDFRSRYGLGEREEAAEARPARVRRAKGAG